jgi:hypothetical protein
MDFLSAAPSFSVRHNYRCRMSATKSWTPVRLYTPNASPFQSKQTGRVFAETAKEQELVNKMDMRNPKGFRIYSSKAPAPTICSYGSEKYCGPGRHTQFITDNEGVRILRMQEAARIMGCLPRVIDQLSTIKESLAFRMIGNMVPTEPIGETLDKMVKTWQAHAHTTSHTVMRGNVMRCY